VTYWLIYPLINELVIYLKLAHNASMLRNWLRNISRHVSLYDPLITVEISRSSLLHNLNEFRKIAPWTDVKTRVGAVAPVLKSNAYGHGIVEVAQILDKENWSHGPNRGSRTPFFVVDSYYEAAILRANKIRTHILIIGYTRPETIRKAKGPNTAFTITSLDMLKKIRDIKYTPWDWETGGNGKISGYLPRNKKAHRVHIKIDTGMHRQGILPSEIEEAIEIVRGSPSIILEGICSHLGDADNADESFTESQISIWNKIIRQFKKEFPDIKYIHLSNTDGHVFSGDINANVSRLGIGLYGLSQNPALLKKVDIKPVLEMKSVVTSKKNILAGEHVGYSNAFTANKNMAIATIPVGYSEGLDRRLSNTGSVLINRKENYSKTSVTCPIIGRVSMNMSSIDISSIPEVVLENPVIVISNNPVATNSVSNIAKICDTIPYEIVVKIPEHLRRVVVE